MKKLLDARAPSQYLKATSCVRAGNNIITVRKGKIGEKIINRASQHSLATFLFCGPGYK